MANTPITEEEHYRVVGQLEQQATFNELLMCTALRVLLKCEPKTARAIFYTLDSFQGKKTLLKRVVDQVGDDEDREIVNDLIDAGEKSNNQRREVAHALMVYHGQGTGIYGEPGMAAFRPKTDDRKVLSKEFHQHLSSQAFAATAEASRAFVQLCQKRGVPFQPDYE